MILDRLFPTPAIRNVSFGEAWLRDVFIGSKSASGEVVNSQTAMGIPAYFACIRVISEDVAKLPLHVYKRRDGRGKDRQPDHPVYRLLHDAPNEEMTAMSFRETITSHALAWKGGFAEIVRRGDGRPAALYLLDPNSVEIERSTIGTLRYKVTVNGQHNYLRSDQVLHIRGLGFDGITQYVLSSLAKESIGAALAAQKHSASFFGNGAVTTGVIQVPGMMKDEALRHLRESFAERHQGAANAYKPFVMENGAEWKPISTDPEKSQLVSTMKFSVEEMARLHRVGQHKIGGLEHATFSNIEHQNIDHYTDTLLPWLVREEQEYNRKLFVKSEQGVYLVEHDMKGVLRGDSAQRVAYYTGRFNNGSMSQNDIRDCENENPIPNGDTYYVPLNMVPSKIAEMGPQATKPPANTPEKAPAAPAEDDNAVSNRVNALARLSAAHQTLLATAVNAYLAFESDRVRTSAKRKDFAAWAENFYSEAPEHVFKAVYPSIQAFCESAWAILCDSPLTEAQALGVHHKTKAICARHVAQSRKEMKDAAVVEKWGAGARAELFARDEIQNLSEWLVSLANEGK